MNKLVLIIGALTFVNSSLASEISLNPGATITVTASETTQITCEGVSSNASAQKTCEILNRNEAQARNLSMRSSSRWLHGFVFQFGKAINNISRDARDVGVIARWCEEQLGN